MISSRYYLGSYKQAQLKRLTLEFLFYYKLKCTVGQKRLRPYSYLLVLHARTGIPKPTIVRNVRRLLASGFMEVKEDIRGKEFYQIVSPEKVCRILGMKIHYKKIKIKPYGPGVIPYRSQYCFITIKHIKKLKIISRILSVELKFNKHKQNYLVQQRNDKLNSVAQNRSNPSVYRGHEIQNTLLYRVPADIIISNKTTAKLLGYRSQGQGHRITRSLLTNKLATSISTPPIKMVADCTPKWLFERDYRRDKYFHDEMTMRVFTRDCSHIFLK